MMLYTSRLGTIGVISAHIPQWGLAECHTGSVTVAKDKLQ